MDHTSRKQILLLYQNDLYVGEVLHRLQSDGFILELCETIEDAKLKLLHGSYYLVIVYFSNGSQDSIGFLREMKEVSLYKWIPIVFLSRTIIFDEKYMCLENGVDDYLSIEQAYDELKFRIRNLIERAVDFEQKAFRDPLTKIYNRGYFNERIRYELEYANKFALPISLVFIDADRFKSINDTYGHDVGDMVLVGLSKMIKDYVGPLDIVARYGGEEFVILMPGVPANEAFSRISYVLDKAHEFPVAEHDEKKRFITFSAGVVEWKPSMSLDEWVKLADTSAYVAKRQGRDRVILGGSHSEQLVIVAKNKRKILSYVPRKLAQSSLRLLEKPKVSE